MSTAPSPYEAPTDLGRWVAENQGLLNAWVGRFDWRIDRDTARSKCLEAVWRAAQRHDATRGAKFSTYVCWWLESARNNAYTAVRTKRRVFERSHTSLHEIEAAETWLLPTYTTTHNRCTERLMEGLERFLPTLSEREQRILSLRYGLAGGIDHEFEEIGRILGISKQAVHQCVTRALNKLRQRFADAGDLKQPADG